MRRFALLTVAASLLFSASRSNAQASTLTLEAFTFDPATELLVGTVGACETRCETVYLTADASTVFVAPDPIYPPNPFYGLFVAWNALLAYYPPNPFLPPNPFYGLLVALGHQGSRAVVTVDGSTLLTFQPLPSGETRGQ